MEFNRQILFQIFFLNLEGSTIIKVLVSEDAEQVCHCE